MNNSHTASASPLFKHDCANCVYLGQSEGQDLYYCDQAGTKMPTVIARWGNEGHEYVSGLWFAKALENPHPLLKEALSRAREKGLLSDEEQSRG